MVEMGLDQFNNLPRCINLHMQCIMQEQNSGVVCSPAISELQDHTAP